ncbi:MAG TPA: hypothetical protein VI653_15040 [Steroidobacteraceae bacterium]
MSSQAPAVRMPKGPRFVVACLAWGNTILSVARYYGFMAATTQVRVVGCAMGLVILGFGLFLQRLHARATTQDNSSKAAADRLLGRILMVAGFTDVALFLSGLEQARLVSLIIGVGVLLALAAGWSWRLRNALLGPTGQNAREKRMLLVTSIYTAATACAAFLFDSRTWTGGLASWMIVVFWLLYIASSASAIEQRDALVKV